MNLEKEEDRSIEGKVYILLMMCKLVDGADPNIEYYSEEDVKDGASLTALEDTLDIFDNVEELCNIDKTEAEILKNIIRRQVKMSFTLKQIQIKICGDRSMRNNEFIKHSIYKNFYVMVL